MRFELKDTTKHVLILGAGASVDYELPEWKNLSILVSKKVNEVSENSSEYKEEILSWMDKVGEGKRYSTIDECITKESGAKEYHTNGLTIEDKIFSVIKSIFKELYKERDNGWINKLNQKILDNFNLEDKIIFINYNYDQVLDDNILQPKHLGQKGRELDYADRIDALSEKQIPIFYPHGNFFSHQELKNSAHVLRRLETKKSDRENLINAISCHESENHKVIKYYSKPIKWYILGLGGGLEINLKNIDFMKSVSKIHVTIQNKNKEDEVIKFLSKKCGIPVTEIQVYKDCDELIEKCFNN